jgi:DNA-binding XRE family transcriptional regulator
MTESKATRDYIKNWGRAAAREHKEQTFQIHNGGLNIGQVKVQWCEPENTFIWVAVLYSLTQKQIYRSESDATAAVHKMYHDMMSTLTFGQWLRVMCRWQRMTIAGLAERLGVTRQTVHYWVKGERQCGDMYIYNQIAALFAHLEQITDAQMLGHMSLLFKRKN